MTRTLPYRDPAGRFLPPCPECLGTGVICVATAHRCDGHDIACDAPGCHAGAALRAISEREPDDSDGGRF